MAITLEEKIEMNEQNIRTALEDYGRYTDDEVLCDVSEDFIVRLAEDATRAKEGLREIFRKSPAWNEELDALVINGNRTHEPDYDRVMNLGNQILRKSNTLDYDDRWDILKMFIAASPDEEEMASAIAAIAKYAPKAYHEGKKKSRVFRDICVALNIADDTAGSEFQRLYAQFADELNAKTIGFKLYASINPAHFITMSNPKRDRRGSTLTSCHSFNSTDYEYNNGCTGYARDGVTFIVFTADDPSSPETLNNRKTTRQLFFYRPGDGVLLQSRMYNTSGGTYGAQADSTLYRDLIQREISEAEGAANLWDTCDYIRNKYNMHFESGVGFGGYEDWTFGNFNPKLSIRKEHAEDFEPFRIGTYGLCIKCAGETSDGVYCDSCYNEDYAYCYRCDDRHHQEDLYEVYDHRGNLIYVCENCRDNYYRRCDVCGDWHDADDMEETADGDWVCRDCLEEYYERCDDCGEWFRTDELNEAIGIYGYTVNVCETCLEANYSQCPECGQMVADELLEDGLCPDCLEAKEAVNNEKESA